MKKRLYFSIILVFIIILTGCNKNNVNVSSGDYVMELQENHESGIAPSIKINTEDKTFVFSHDMLSSYLTHGTYEISEGYLIAITYDNKYKYVFKIIAETTLSIDLDKSSVITTIDKRITIPVYDGAKFIKSNKEK